ncbi:MAG: toll/interleukin-1 receptor domain-containing protein [Lachnospiraceae bacterium]|nr:toll/interleukin-1 receptor domain-containing protein [Lachnospiraceae bacterium]
MEPTIDNGNIDVFLSYSSKNKNVADAVVADFEQHGIRCWYAPRDIMPGQEWVSAIHDAIKRCRLFVLIYTEGSNESKQVANEVALAFNSGKTLIPFKLSDTAMSSELEYYLTSVHWLDAVDPPLIKSIESLRNYSEMILEGRKPSGPMEKNADSDARKSPHAWVYPLFTTIFLLLIVTIVVLMSNKKEDEERAKESAAAETSAVESTSALSESKDESKAETENGKAEAASTGDVNEASTIYRKAYDYQLAARNKAVYDRAYECYMQTGDEPCEDEKIVSAMAELAAYFYEGGGEEDIKKGLDLYEKAAANGNVQANNILGNRYLETDKENKEDGSPLEMTSYNGISMSEEVRKAILYYEVSAGKGDAVALYNLGFTYENEYDAYNITSDKDKALTYYEKAAKAGHTGAEKAYNKLKDK